MKKIGSVKYDEMKPLDEKGFNFIGLDSRPYKCRIWNDRPWLFYWHSDKKWISCRPVNQSEIWNMPKNLTQDEQDMYDNLHKEK